MEQHRWFQTEDQEKGKGKGKEMTRRSLMASLKYGRRFVNSTMMWQRASKRINAI
jgi:hypothetical protein